MDLNALTAFLQDGGPAMWAIAALSVLTATLVMWKIWRLALAGVWSSAPDAALAVWAAGDRRAVDQVTGKYFIRCKATASSSLSYDKKLQQQLWEYSSQCVGLS